MRASERAALARLKDLGGDQLVRDLLATYLAQTSERIAGAHNALGQRDSALLAASAHAIRSSSAQLGAQELVTACESLEASAESRDLARAAEALRDVSDAFDALGAWLGELGLRDDGSVNELNRVAEPRPPVGRPLTIAVVEDNADNRLLIDAMIGETYRLDEYASGAEALEMMSINPPALVLLDVSLFGMDGLEVLSRMRRDSVLRDIPVIAVTAHAMTGDRERYLAAGFDGYVPKPIVDERVLIDAIERLLPGGPEGGERDGQNTRDWSP
jgi:two-component system, cell cycle response regulator DivK